MANVRSIGPFVQVPMPWNLGPAVVSGSCPVVDVSEYVALAPSGGSASSPRQNRRTPRSANAHDHVAITGGRA